MLTLAWLYDEPLLANTPAVVARAGALVVVPHADVLPAALSAVAVQLRSLGLGGSPCGNLHVAIASEWLVVWGCVCVLELGAWGQTVWEPAR